jgi:glycerol-3-phosphate O-acyltransferase
VAECCRPKAGILGMTVHSFIREHSRPLVFVPVYIGYEKLDRRTAVTLASWLAKPKQRESHCGALSCSIRSIRRVFRQGSCQRR